MNDLNSRPRARAAQCARREGVTLVELLLAAAVAGVVLAAAWAWVWNVAALATRVDADAQAAGAAAAAVRAVARDVSDAVSVVSPRLGRDPATSLELRHDHLDSAPEDVVIAWDPARGVVWRNAAGTYLSDRVSRFSTSYVVAGGRRVAGGEMSSADWRAVRLVCVDLAVSVGARTARRSVKIGLGS